MCCRQRKVREVKPRLVVLLLLAGLIPALPGKAQIVGTSSLVTIPVADMPPDGAITFGGGFVDRRYSAYLSGRVDYTPLSVSVGFLPFLEVGFRFSRPLNLDDRERLGDRMVSARFRILTEGRRRPAIVVGAHDFLTVEERNYFNALYVVGSKHFDAVIPVGLHAGYGADLMEALAHQFVGPFGGVSFRVVQHGELLLEYDADRVNAGVRVELLDHFRGVLAVQGLRAIIAGASILLQL